MFMPQKISSQVNNNKDYLFCNSSPQLKKIAPAILIILGLGALALAGYGIGLHSIPLIASSGSLGTLLLIGGIVNAVKNFKSKKLEETSNETENKTEILKTYIFPDETTLLKKLNSAYVESSLSSCIHAMDNFRLDEKGLNFFLRQLTTKITDQFSDKEISCNLELIVHFSQ